MPPGHGHRGGHGGGGRHHHGGGRPGGWQGGWGPGWSGPGYWGAQPAYAELVVPSCPGTYDPVLATDGRVYDNECLARTAGYAVVRRAPPRRIGGLGGIGPFPDLAVAGIFAVGLYLLLRPKR